MTSRHSSAIHLQELNTEGSYREDLAQQILGKPGSYPAFFRVYDELFEIKTAACFAAIDVQQDCAPINHAAILIAAQHLRTSCTLSLEEFKRVLARDLGINSTSQIDSIITLATQAMLMADVNVRAQYAPNYIVGDYCRPEWKCNQTLVEFIDSCFQKLSEDQQGYITQVLADKALLAAGNLSSRVSLKFKGTNNIAEHLLLDTDNLTLYFFHHAEYIRAHLGSWGDFNSAKTASLEEAIGRFVISKPASLAHLIVYRGTLWPALLAETLRSTQSILFCYDDRTSMKILRTAVTKQKLDRSCLSHEGYRMFRDSDEDLPYIYWGQRLIDLHTFLHNPQPRTRFQRWIAWQTTESNSFLIAMLALVITIIIGIITLGLTAVQVWISWQAWKHPNESSA